MPHHCSAYGCTNRQINANRLRGITFHRFPINNISRKRWEGALRRKAFNATTHSRLCSDHFRKEDFDRTGQTVRIRDGVVPSVFNFPAKLKTPVATKTSEQADTATSQNHCTPHVTVGEPQPDPSLVGHNAKDCPHRHTCDTCKGQHPTSLHNENHKANEKPQRPANAAPTTENGTQAATALNVTKDHSYALPKSPEDLKARLDKAMALVEGLEREKRNAKDRERRTKTRLCGLLKELRAKNLINDGQLWGFSWRVLKRGNNE